jgi:hypothetical protein
VLPLIPNQVEDRLYISPAKGEKKIILDSVPARRLIRSGMAFEGKTI